MNLLQAFPRRTAALFFRDDAGQDLVEYALVATLIAVGVAASVRSIQTAIVNAAYQGISTVMSSF